MAETEYDAIVIGARCAGSPTAMLLAQRGYRVLVVDRATFPSDTVSTHLVHPPGVAALARWGILDQLAATGCPPIHTYTFDFGPITMAGAPGTPESPVAYCPRRTVLDALLVAAADRAGAEVREGFHAQELVEEDGRVVGIRGHGDGGGSVTERARVVVGADGRNSFVAKHVKPEQYHEKPEILQAYYSYWSGLPIDGRFEVYQYGDRGWAAAPTHDGLSLVVGGWPHHQHDTLKHDIEGEWLAMFERAPEFAERIRGATREEKFSGTAVPNYFRKPYGPGWALVGDTGYNRDFITAQGISDAFRDAELCTTALDAALSGARPFDDAMAEYQAIRDEQVFPMYEFTAQVASLEPPPPEQIELFTAIAGNQDAMDGFARVNAGVMSPADFFDQENIGRIFAASTQSGQEGSP